MVGVEFRLFKAGEQYLTTSYGIGKSNSNGVSPRIILQDKPKRRVLVIEYDIADPGNLHDVTESQAQDMLASRYGRRRIEERD